MPNSITKPITVNGWVNAMTALKTAGYTGSGTCSFFMIYNPSATVPVYMHFTSDGTASPSTGTDGMPVLKDAPSSNFTLGRGSNFQGIDLGLLWLFTGSSILVTIAVIGA